MQLWCPFTDMEAEVQGRMRERKDVWERDTKTCTRVVTVTNCLGTHPMCQAESGYSVHVAQLSLATASWGWCQSSSSLYWRRLKHTDLRPPNRSCSAGWWGSIIYPSASNKPRKTSVAWSQLYVGAEKVKLTKYRVAWQWAQTIEKDGTWSGW